MPDSTSRFGTGILSRDQQFVVEFTEEDGSLPEVLAIYWYPTTADNAANVLAVSGLPMIPSGQGDVITEKMVSEIYRSPNGRIKGFTATTLDDDAAGGTMYWKCLQGDLI